MAFFGGGFVDGVGLFATGQWAGGGGDGGGNKFYHAYQLCYGHEFHCCYVA